MRCNVWQNFQCIFIRNTASVLWATLVHDGVLVLMMTNQYNNCEVYPRAITLVMNLILKAPRRKQPAGYIET